MSDFLPVYEDADRITCIAGGAIVGGNVVVLSASTTPLPTVTASAGAGVVAIGVALHDAAVGQQVTVTRTGIVELVTTANVVFGDAIGPSTTGGVATVATPTNPYSVIGLALNTVTAPAVVRVALRIQ
jgi:hypothetical protein